VRVAATDAGAQEILAVGAFGPAQETETAPAPETRGGAPAVTISGPLPLPYSLPE
jgi:hypothetical protein